MLVAESIYRRTALPTASMGALPPRQFVDALPAILEVKANDRREIINTKSLIVLSATTKLVVTPPRVGVSVESNPRLLVAKAFTRNNYWSKA